MGFRQLLRDTRGELQKIIGISVGLLVAAILIPIAMTQILEAENIADWGAVGVVFQVLMPVLAIIAIALYFVPKYRGK